MQSRHAFILLVTLILITAWLAAFSQVFPRKEASPPIPQLENVRDYVSAVIPGGADYAVDGGRLYVGHPGYWVEIPLPVDVIAGAVDVSVTPATDGGLINEIIYVGAANHLTVYRTEDRGEHWLDGVLTHSLVHKGLVGGITDLAVDPIQRLIYAGTDTAGLFRMRDAGETMKSTAQLLLDEPVVQVVTDRNGSGMTYVRTQWELYRGTDFGLQWHLVDLLRSLPTTMAIAGTQPPSLFLGTSNRGLLRTEDGLIWRPVNNGLPMTPSLPVSIDAVAVDPIQPRTAYVAVSHLIGNRYTRYAATQLSYTRDGGRNWLRFDHPRLAERVSELLPVSGYSAATYLLTASSRTPQVVGNAPTGAVPALVSSPQPETGTRGMAWIAAGLAALALAFALVTDVLSKPEVPLSRPGTLQPRPVRRNRW
jgi:hypothetical protein